MELIGVRAASSFRPAVPAADATVVTMAMASRAHTNIR